MISYQLNLRASVMICCWWKHIVIKRVLPYCSLAIISHFPSCTIGSQNKKSADHYEHLTSRLSWDYSPIAIVCVVWTNPVDWVIFWFPFNNCVYSGILKMFPSLSNLPVVDECLKYFTVRIYMPVINDKCQLIESSGRIISTISWWWCVDMTYNICTGWLIS